MKCDTSELDFPALSLCCDPHSGGLGRRWKSGNYRDLRSAGTAGGHSGEEKEVQEVWLLPAMVNLQEPEEGLRCGMASVDAVPSFSTIMCSFLIQREENIKHHRRVTARTNCL